MTISTAIRMMGPTIDMIWIGRLGTAALAGVGVSGIAVQVINSARMGLNTGTRAMLARFVGAGDEQGANHVAQQAFVISVAFSLIMAAIGIFLAEHVVRVFNREPQLVEIAGTFLRIDIVSYMVFGIVVVLMHCLNGMGDTMVPMFTTLATMWLIQVPMAYILPKTTDMGVYGVRWAIVTAIAIRAVTYSLYFKNGRWRRKAV